MIWYIVSIVILLIALWLAAMVELWNINKGTYQGPAEERVANLLIKTVRLIRRGWYASLRAIVQGLKVLAVYIARGFFAIFPNAKSAFENKDELTGLTDGPSSYFLMSVSEYKEEIKKITSRRGRNKKNV